LIDGTLAWIGRTLIDGTSSLIDGTAYSFTYSIAWSARSNVAGLAWSRAVPRRILTSRVGNGHCYS
jgi:hypothetical protein